MLAHLRKGLATSPPILINSHDQKVSPKILLIFPLLKKAVDAIFVLFILEVKNSVTPLVASVVEQLRTRKRCSEKLSRFVR
jgi:hypothetical protein